MSEIIMFIKRNVLDKESVKNIDTIEVFNSWDTLYLFLFFGSGIYPSNFDVRYMAQKTKFSNWVLKLNLIKFYFKAFLR